MGDQSEGSSDENLNFYVDEPFCLMACYFMKFLRALLFFFMMSELQSLMAASDIQTFHERATHGERLNVVFLGGSLTWGANASDPQRTSWRGLMMQYLVDTYPKSSFLFSDAAIGGTGSGLAMYRIDRDVIPRKPDLVFLDCTVNDNAEGSDIQSLASYERVMRDLVSSSTAVFPVLLCFRNHVENPDAPVPPRHQAHLKLAQAYGLPVANVLDALRGKVKSGADPKKLWAFLKDNAHPDDAGYAAMFEAIRDSWQKEVKSDTKVAIPKDTFFPDLYPHRDRQILAEHPLPVGWAKDKTRRTSMWFDGLSSRWMSEVIVAKMEEGKKPEALEVKFRGSSVGIFGERDAISVPIRVWIDGKAVPPPKVKPEDGDLWTVSTERFGSPESGAAYLFNWMVFARDLPDGEHTLRIEPDFTNAAPGAEFRIESVCSAGR